MQMRNVQKASRLCVSTVNWAVMTLWLNMETAWTSSSMRMALSLASTAAGGLSLMAMKALAPPHL